MDSETLTPNESLELISGVILDARKKFKDDGSIYIMWGVLITVAGIGQFLLNYYEYYSINYYPYFLMPVGGIISFVYYRKKEQKGSNAISRLIGRIWLVILINVLLLGFVFATELQESLVPTILIFIGLGTISSGTALRDNTILVPGLLINLIGIVAFFIDWYYHPLIIAGTGFFLNFIPGIILSIKNKG